MIPQYPIEKAAELRRLLHWMAFGMHLLLAASVLLWSSASAADQASVAAVRLLASLTPEQRALVERPFEAAQPAALKSPPGTQEAIEAKNHYRGTLGDRYVDDFLRAQTANGKAAHGLRLHALEARQITAFLRLLENTLSSSGLKKFADVTAAADLQGDTGANGWIHPSYVVTLFGSPDPVRPWILQISGDHFLLSVRFSDGEAIVLHSFMGARLTTIQSAGQMVRVLGAERDKAFALMKELDERQREQVAIKVGVGDLTLWPEDGFPLPATDRLKASGMSMKQREKLLALITEWAGMLDPAYTEKFLARVKEAIPETWIVWAGALTPRGAGGGAAYFRIHGPNVYIEYAPQPLLGDADGTHVHSTYRAQ